MTIGRHFHAALASNKIVNIIYSFPTTEKRGNKKNIYLMFQKEKQKHNNSKLWKHKNHFPINGTIEVFDNY